MMIKNRVSLFIATFLIIGSFFLALPEKGYSGFDPLVLGCCRPDSMDSCIGCESGCAITAMACGADIDVPFTPGNYCEAVDGGAECNLARDDGCCVTLQGECRDETISSCQSDQNVNNKWFSSSCAEVPECPAAPVAPASIPTFNQWGLLAMASILGIVGFMVIRRRKVTA